jgi:hypothetical protein
MISAVVHIVSIIASPELNPSVIDPVTYIY